MTIRLTIDRFEGDKKQVAVLLTDAGEPINFPRGLLPKGSKPGDIVKGIGSRKLDEIRSQITTR